MLPTGNQVIYHVVSRGWEKQGHDRHVKKADAPRGSVDETIRNWYAREHPNEYAIRMIYPDVTFRDAISF